MTVRRESYWLEIAAVLAAKACALVAIYFLFFSHPVEQAAPSAHLFDVQEN